MNNFIIKSSVHKISFLNKGKVLAYQDFLNDYNYFCQRVLDHIWRFGYKDFSVRDKKLDLDKFINYKDFKFVKTELSARAKSSAVDQVSAVIRSSVEKQRRVIWVRDNKCVDVKDKKFSKPNVKFFKPNLSSKCCDFLKSDGKFFGFIKLKSLGKKYGTILIPLEHSVSIVGKMRSGFIFAKNKIQVCWDVETVPCVRGDKVLAIDQGLIDVATCSDGQVSPKTNAHGKTLSSILDKLARKKKGSKAFKRAESERTNFVNWSINQLNFDGVKEVRLEKIVNIRFKKKTSRKMSHWSNPEIRNKIFRICSILEVPVVEQYSAYRSQRCNQCGIVRKANRKGKIYSCKHCGYCADADFNASLNHQSDLPIVPRGLLGQKYNLGNGFYWKPCGFYNFDGSELRVPNC